MRRCTWCLNEVTVGVDGVKRDGHSLEKGDQNIGLIGTCLTLNGFKRV